MEFLECKSLANNKDYSFSKANFEKVADEAKKKLNKIYALVMKKEVFGVFKDDIFEGYQL